MREGWEQGLAAQMARRRGAEEEGKVGYFEHLQLSSGEAELNSTSQPLPGSRGLKRSRGGGVGTAQQPSPANDGEDRGEREPKVWMELDMF